jgi:hypothetical protein
MKCGVRRLRTGADRLTALELDNGETVTADWVLSSAGADETRLLWEDNPAAAGGTPFPPASDDRLGFVETIQMLDRQPHEFGWMRRSCSSTLRPLRVCQSDAARRPCAAG